MFFHPQHNVRPSHSLTLSLSAVSPHLLPHLPTSDRPANMSEKRERDIDMIVQMMCCTLQAIDCGYGVCIHAFSLMHALIALHRIALPCNSGCSSCGL